MRKKNHRFLLICLTFLLFATALLNIRKIAAEDNMSVVPVSSGTDVVVYEQTTDVYQYTFSVSDLMGNGSLSSFGTMADEFYTVTSDGTYLKIRCYRANWLLGTAVGNNIVAVKLCGVPTFPEGLWASSIVNYTLGYAGTAESRFNSLGPDTQVGPYMPAPLATLMGDQDSELVLGFAPPPITPAVKLTGSLDYLSDENVTVKLAALVQNAKTMEPLPEANVTLQIYYPNDTLWVSDKMVEKLRGTGIYEWESAETIYQTKLTSGVYIAYANASVNGGPEALDIVLFHVDPPSGMESPIVTSWPYYATLALASVVGTIVGITLFRRRRKSPIFQRRLTDRI
jgi:hypothetical protein